MSWPTLPRVYKRTQLGRAAHWAASPLALTGLLGFLFFVTVDTACDQTTSGEGADATAPGADASTSSGSVDATAGSEASAALPDVADAPVPESSAPDGSLSHADGSLPDSGAPDAFVAESSAPDTSFPETPSTGSPVSYDAGIVTDLATSLTAFILSITPGSGTSSASLANYNGFTAAVGDCIAISGTGTAYDGGHGGTCAAGYPVVSTADGNPSTVVFNTTVSSSYSSAVTNDSASVLLKAANGTILSFYRHGSTDVTDPGVIVLRTSTNGGTTWTPYTGTSHLRQANDTWVETAPGGRCGAGVKSDMPGCLVADHSGSCDSSTSDRDVTNLAGGVTQNGTVVLFWDNGCWNPHEWGGIYYARSEDNGASWSAPSRFATSPPGQSVFSWCGTYGGLFALPSGLAMPLMGYPGTQELCQAPGYGYLVLSHDDGKTWGLNQATDFIRVRDANHEQLPTNENSYAYAGNSRIIGFGRDTCSGPSCPFLFHSSSDLGATWTISETNLGPTDPSPGQTLVSYKLVSPWLFDAKLPSGQLTLVFAERQTDTNISNVDALRAISFDPAAVIQNPQGFGPTQTLWTSEYNDWGYPSAVQTSPTTLLFQWDSQQYPAGPLNLFNMTAQFGCRAGQSCTL